VRHEREHATERPDMNLRPHRGTYALVLSLDSATTLRVGRRGAYRIEPGFYVYVGTAFGPGGVKARRRPVRLTFRPAPRT
jgi:hypothetical protein